jgi:hypothetical protein
MECHLQCNLHLPRTATSGDLNFLTTRKGTTDLSRLSEHTHTIITMAENRPRSEKGTGAAHSVRGTADENNAAPSTIWDHGREQFIDETLTWCCRHCMTPRSDDTRGERLLNFAGEKQYHLVVEGAGVWHFLQRDSAKDHLLSEHGIAVGVLKAGAIHVVRFPSMTAPSEAELYKRASIKRQFFADNIFPEDDILAALLASHSPTTQAAILDTLPSLLPLGVLTPANAKMLTATNMEIYHRFKRTEERNLPPREVAAILRTMPCQIAGYAFLHVYKYLVEVIMSHRCPFEDVNGTVVVAERPVPLEEMPEADAEQIVTPQSVTRQDNSIVRSHNMKKDLEDSFHRPSLAAEPAQSSKEHEQRLNVFPERHIAQLSSGEVQHHSSEIAGHFKMPGAQAVVVDRPSDGTSYAIQGGGLQLANMTAEVLAANIAGGAPREQTESAIKRTPHADSSAHPLQTAYTGTAIGSLGMSAFDAPSPFAEVQQRTRLRTLYENAVERMSLYGRERTARIAEINHRAKGLREWLKERVANEVTAAHAEDSANLDQQIFWPSFAREHTANIADIHNKADGLREWLSARVEQEMSAVEAEYADLIDQVQLQLREDIRKHQ